jgi:hypothetical protein
MEATLARGRLQQSAGLIDEGCLNEPVDTSDGAEQPSPDDFEVTVEGFAFRVSYDLSQPGAYHYTRLAGAAGGPAVGYGFTSRSSDYGRRSEAEHVRAIRDFIANVDPVTGYLED